MAWIPWASDPRGAACVVAAAISSEIGRYARVYNAVEPNNRLWIKVRVRWWVWFGLGLGHLWLWRRANKTACHVRPPAYHVRVTVL